MSQRLTTLDNGIRIITDYLPNVATAAIGIWVETGARHETAEVNGISHFLEHMAFKGTKTRTARQIAEEIENVGGYLNAYTSREHTAYHARVLGENVPLALNLLADILLHSIFDPDELERERQVILQEINQTMDTPDDVVFDYFQATAFPHQALGRTILGKSEIILALKQSDLKQYMDEQYLPNRIIVSASGQINPDQVIEIVSRHFLQIPSKPSSPLVSANYIGGTYFQQKDLEQVHLVLGFESYSNLHPDYYASLLFSNLLGEGMSSRLFQEIREKRGLAYSIYSFIFPFKDTGILGIYAGTGSQQTLDLIPCLKDTLGNFTQTLTEKEILRSKAQLKAVIMMAFESTAARCEYLANQVSIYGRPLSINEMNSKIESISLDDVRRVGNHVLNSPHTYTSLGPSEPLKWS